jgi:hypothetical protein
LRAKNSSMIGLLAEAEGVVDDDDAGVDGRVAGCRRCRR